MVPLEKFQCSLSDCFGQSRNSNKSGIPYRCWEVAPTQYRHSDQSQMKRKGELRMALSSYRLCFSKIKGRMVGASQPEFQIRGHPTTPHRRRFQLKAF